MRRDLARPPRSRRPQPADALVNNGAPRRSGVPLTPRDIGILVLPLLAIVPFLPSFSSFAVLMLAAVCAAIPFLTAFMMRGATLAPILVGLVVYVSVTLKTGLLFALGSDDPNVSRLLRGLPLGKLTPALVYLLVALTLLCFGMVVGYAYAPEARQLRDAPLDARRTEKWIRRLLVFAGLAYVFFALRTGVRFTSLSSLSAKRFENLQGGSASRVRSLPYLIVRLAGTARATVPLALVLVLLSAEPAVRKRSRRLLAAAVFLSILLAFTINSRAGVVLILLDIMVLLYLFGHTPSRRTILGVGVVGLVFMLAILGVRQASQSTSRIDQLERTMLGRDLLDITKLATITSHTEMFGSLGGQTLWGWMAAPVPDALLPVTRPLWAGQGKYVWTNVYGGQGKNGVPASLPGELLLNAGRLGFVLGMFCFGLLLGLLSRRWRRRSTSVASTVVFAIVITRVTIFGLANDFGTGVVKAVLEVIPLLIVLRLCRVSPVRLRRNRWTIAPPGPAARRPRRQNPRHVADTTQRAPAPVPAVSG
jgi:oligosaccharide repeat unit polymerase